MQKKTFLMFVMAYTAALPAFADSSAERASELSNVIQFLLIYFPL